MGSALVQLTIFVLSTSAVSAVLHDAIKRPDPSRVLHPIKRAPASLNPGFIRVGSNPLAKRQDCQIFDYCDGTCEECFGDGFTYCPGDSLLCYKPGDACYDIDTCDSSSGSSSIGYSSSYATISATPTYSSYSSYTASASYSSYDSYFTSTDYCSGSCVTCWGAGYVGCPNDDDYCYDPSNSTSVCPDGSSGGSSAGSSSDDGSCAEKWGAGNVQCGEGCYNPDIGEDCCSNGHFCSTGTVCSSTVGECEYADSSSSSYGSYSGYSSSTYSSSSSSSYSYDSYTTTPADSGFAASTTAETSSASSNTFESGGSTTSGTSVPVSGSEGSSGAMSAAPSQHPLLIVTFSAVAALLGIVYML